VYSTANLVPHHRAKEANMSLSKEQLLEMGKDAPLGEDMIQAFPAGNLSSFAHKELPGIMKALGVSTIGQLAARTKSEIHGPQCRYAGNKTVWWIESVCREFGLTPPQYGEPAAQA